MREYTTRRGLQKHSENAENEGVAEYLNKLVHARIGHYVLVREIGRGTHYTLFQAVDPRLGRMVVIKILHVSSAPAPSENEGEDAAPDEAKILEARLRREADALARLSHPNILAVYETGEHDGYDYLVMEYLHGHPLRQYLGQGALPLAEALTILEQVARALDAVHDEGILHRAISPSSVMMLHDGSVKLMDFGLARRPDDITVTLMGAPVGEPAYMAPEQLRDRPAGPASDIWALGVLLYEMLAGHPPFQASSFPLVAHQVIMLQHPPLAGFPQAVQAVLDKALEKDPEHRYQRAGDMVTALRGAGPSPMLSLPRPTAPQSRTGLMLGAVGLALAAALMIGIKLFGHVPGVPSPVAKAAVVPLSVPQAPPPAKPSSLPTNAVPVLPSTTPQFLNTK